VVLVTLTVTYFATAANRSPPNDFLLGLPASERAQVRADIDAFGIYGWKGPISCRWIKGHSPLLEIRTRGFRSYCVVHGKTLWVLQVGKKESQGRDIKVAAKRMKMVRGG
jgi:hypothetical protein